MGRKNSLIKILSGSNYTLSSLGILILRCTIGIVLFNVGAGKVLGWFGGQGMETTIENYIKMGIALPLAYLSIYTEFLGSLLLIAGLFTRPVAVAVIVNMLVATITVWPTGFVTGHAALPFSLLMAAIVVLLTGPMKYSLDSLFWSSPIRLHK